jgi:hypothetical protein
MKVIRHDIGWRRCKTMPKKTAEAADTAKANKELELVAADWTVEGVGKVTRKVKRRRRAGTRRRADTCYYVGGVNESVAGSVW